MCMGIFLIPTFILIRSSRNDLPLCRITRNMHRLPLAIDKTYDLDTFLRGALDHGKDRCLFCYRMRLEKTFKKGS